MSRWKSRSMSICMIERFGSITVGLSRLAVDWISSRSRIAGLAWGQMICLYVGVWRRKWIFIGRGWNLRVKKWFSTLSTMACDLFQEFHAYHCECCYKKSNEVERLLGRLKGFQVDVIFLEPLRLNCICNMH